MAHPYHHALSSVKKWGGVPEDYQAIHDWFDESKAHVADFRHRALRHHSEGIFMAEKIFGTTITNSAGRVVPVRYIGEQHVKEDLGKIPTLADWCLNIKPERWMLGRNQNLEKELENDNRDPAPDETQRWLSPADGALQDSGSPAE
jgi:hypothetical protein